MAKRFRRLLLWCSSMLLLLPACKHAVNNMIRSPETPLEIEIREADLPHRTAPILAREAAGAIELKSSLTAGEELTLRDIQEGLTSDSPEQCYSAAFLCGRLRLTDPALGHQLAAQLRGLIESDKSADFKIEAAMSLVLLGETAKGKATLEALLASKEPLGDQYKAGFFLAQLGEKKGWPALVAILEDEIAHYRLMGLRHLIAFLPYEGQMVAGHKIFVYDRAVDCLKDVDEMVRAETPFYLEEMEHPNLKGLLEKVLREDSAENVRAAAELVLSRQ